MQDDASLPIQAQNGNSAQEVTPVDASEPIAEKHHRSVMIKQEFGGPLPPPGFLREYNEVIPGLAERLVQAFDEERTHRHRLEETGLQAEIDDQKASRRERRRGQLCGCAVCIAAIICGTTAAIVAPVAGQLMGGLIGVGGLTGLVYVFITGRTIARHEQSQMKQQTNKKRKKSKK